MKYNRLVAGLAAAALGWVALAQATHCSAQPPATLAAFAADSAPPVGEEEPLAEADLICVVGTEHILAGDMLVFVEPIIEENRKSIPPSQEAAIRRQLTRRFLPQYVELKAMYLEFFRETVNKSGPSEMKEARQGILTKANKLFYERQVPNLLERNKVPDIKALEEKLRGKSMSLAMLRRQFVETVLATEAERRHVPEDVEIGRDELLQYYADHAEDWQKPGRAKWRQLTARFDRFGDKAAAKGAIELMGNEIFLGGKPFEAVAKERSHGFTASEGGLVDWTTQGSLKSKPIDQAIFSIPLNRLSQVIEDDIGFHIIEVLEREDAHTVSFEEAQLDMREALVDAKKAELRKAFHKKVMDRTVVWTRWPEDIPGSRALADVLND